MTETELNHRRRRFAAVLFTALSIIAAAVYSGLAEPKEPAAQPAVTAQTTEASNAAAALSKLEVKGRAPKTGYSRQQFGGGWASVDGCDVRNRILARDLSEALIDKDNCSVLSGVLNDPYTGLVIEFRRGSGTSSAVQIDHVVALSDAWQKGAQQLPAEKRLEFANDRLNLLAVDGPVNVKKGGADAASWLPPNKPYRCRYVARQIAVKVKYLIWVTQAEYDALKRVLQSCPGQLLPQVET